MAVRVIRVLLVDDHTIVRRALVELLPTLGSFEVVGEAADGGEVLALVELVRPDLVLLDLSLPHVSGFEVTRKLTETRPDLPVLILSMHDDKASVVKALHAGARGYVCKWATPEELRLAMLAVTGGRLYLSATLDHPLAGRSLRAAQTPDRQDMDLTPRELQVLQLVGGGCTTKEIAQLLSISPHTAHHHRTSLKQRLGVRTNADLVRIAVERGLIAA